MAGLFLSWFWFGVWVVGRVFIPGQIFNEIFILISIFDAFTVTISSFHQQPSLAISNLPKISEEVTGN